METKTLTLCMAMLVIINFRCIRCINLGYISPIEVVEEWGCHNTEIRLTCPHLDSTIGVLEATFTPNCTETVDGDENNCAHIDLKRLTRAYTSPLIDHQMAETEAGRKFLDTMRRSKEIEAALNESLATNRIADIKHQSYIELKTKRNSLRASLEELILEYLRGLSPPGDEENYMEFSKRIRKKREIYVNEQTQHENNSDKLDLVVDSDVVYQRTEIGAMNITVTSDNDDDEDSDTKYDRYKGVSERSVCLEHRRRITQLDQFTLDQCVEDDADDEHNIRRILNYRCAGKNHCSFIFSMDHPFSMLWDSGTVRLKYVCMEDFRLNKYCGEHLLIGPEKQSVDDFTKSNERRGEPVAEARIQTDQSFHHLKILKSGDTNDALGSVDSSATNENDKKKWKNQRVYSQDFRILKILPSNADDTSDIGKIGNEIYFKKDENEIEDSRMPHSTAREPFAEVVTHAELDDNNEAENDILQNENSNWSKYRKLSTSIEKLLNPSSGPAERTTTTTTTTALPVTDENSNTHQTSNSGEENSPIDNETIQEDVDTLEKELLNEIIRKNESSQTDPPSFTDKLNRGNLAIDSSRPTEHDQRVISTLPTTYHNINNKIYKQKSVIKSNDILDETKDPYYDDGDYSYEDFAVEYNGRTVIRQNKIRNHTSYQTSFFKQPLLQGFIATTGYPKYYIGESNCSWKISAPIGARVRVTILDINLRYDFTCKDFIQIFDLEIGRMLFNSCSEYARPVQVLSDSNHIMINVNTTSKVAYPKRGVLLHYTALGCLTPSAPLHGRLVHKTENSARYICDPTFVFPDTAVSSRELICTSSHTWDKVLPNCIEKSAVRKTGVITVSQFNHKQHSKVTMAEKDDLMNNIIIPSSVIAVLFIVNALVFLAIMRCRQRKRSLDFDHHEMAQL